MVGFPLESTGNSPCERDPHGNRVLHVDRRGEQVEAFATSARLLGRAGA